MAAHVTDSQRDGGSQRLASGHGMSQSPPCSPRGWPPTIASQRATAQHGPEAQSHELPHGSTRLHPTIHHRASPSVPPSTQTRAWDQGRTLGIGRGERFDKEFTCNASLRKISNVTKSKKNPGKTHVPIFYIHSCSCFAISPFSLSPSLLYIQDEVEKSFFGEY